jgi:RHS repeat-associated protein
MSQGAYDETTNRLGTSSGLFEYDNNGNLTKMSPETLAYDAENRQTKVSSASDTATYTYDGDGRRVTKTAGGNTTTYVYDATGELAAEYVTVAQSADCPTCYLTTDPLGSTRVITDGNGNVVSRHDYYPFGEELATSNRTSALQYGVTDYVAQRFTGKFRDMTPGWEAGLGLDYFGARYYASSMGRMLSPDPGSPTPLHLLNPQRWNMYSYALNNPFSYTDSTGMDAAAVNFSKEIAIVGHEGIMSVHSDGTVVYARFGPAGGSRPAGPGEVQSFALNAKVQFDSNGQPTTDSLNAVKKELATSGPEKGQDPSSIRINYFKTTPEETANLDQWIKQQQDASNRGQSPRYNVATNNCTMFCQRGLVVAGVLDQNQANHASPAPNGFWWQLWELQSRPVKACTSATDSFGNTTGTHCE